MFGSCRAAVSSACMPCVVVMFCDNFVCIQVDGLGAVGWEVRGGGCGVEGERGRLWGGG